jgi:hypothetical protein
LSTKPLDAPARLTVAFREVLLLQEIALGHGRALSPAETIAKIRTMRFAELRKDRNARLNVAGWVAMLPVGVLKDLIARGEVASQWETINCERVQTISPTEIAKLIERLTRPTVLPKGWSARNHASDPTRPREKGCPCPSPGNEFSNTAKSS